MSTVRSEQHAGQLVWRGRALLQFDSDGVCLGVIRRTGEEQCDIRAEPEPLTEDDITACAEAGWVTTPRRADSPQQPDVAQTTGDEPDRPLPVPPAQDNPRGTRKRTPKESKLAEPKE